MEEAQPSGQRMRQSKHNGNTSACNMKRKGRLVCVGQSEGGGGAQA